MREESGGVWVDVPVERIAVKMHPQRGPVQMRITFADGTRRIVRVDPAATDPPEIEEILCRMAPRAEEPLPCWWG